MKQLIVLIAVLWLFAGCTLVKKPEEVRVGIVSWPGYEPLALADTLNYYSKEEIKIIRFPSIIDVLGAIRNGTIDVAALTIDESLVYAQENPDIRAFLVCDFSNGGDGVVAKEGITRADQLKGKRIAAEESALSAYILERFLAFGGLTHGDVTVVPVNFDYQLQVFSSDQADALITYNPVKEQLIARGGELLFDSTQMPGEIVDVLIASDTVLKAKKKSIEHLVDGWYRSVAYMKSNPEDAYKRIAALEGISEEMFVHSLAGIKIPSRSESAWMLNRHPGSLYKTSRGLIESMRSQGLLRKEVTFEHFFTPDYNGGK